MISSNATTWEAEPVQKLAAEGQLQAYRNNGFWEPMENLRDRVHLEQFWESGKAPWSSVPWSGVTQDEQPRRNRGGPHTPGDWLRLALQGVFRPYPHLSGLN